MFVERPMLIQNRATSPDYISPLRGGLDRTFGSSAGDFAKFMDNASIPLGKEAIPLAKDAIPLDTQKERMIQNAISREGQGIALDERSLTTLSRMGVKKPSVPPSSYSASLEKLGNLSAAFESGSQGSAAIGYDKNGGTSYGKYQISSRQGTFDNFIAFLSDKEPSFAQRLSNAGPANTGSRHGAVPTEWQAIAEEAPERFLDLQEAFIRQSHYEPAAANIQEKLGLQSISPTMQEVIFSTAVQHGPAGAQRIFSEAAHNLGSKAKDEKNLISEVYKLRKNQFGSSTPEVQYAVAQRFDAEKAQALAMLG